MKRLFTIIFCIAAFQSVTTLAQPVYSDTSMYEENFRPNYLGYKPAVAPIITELKKKSYDNSTLGTRLSAIERDVQLDYNEFVQAYINTYTAPGRREDMGRIMGLSKYYFPIYEKAFKDAGIPEEIKYLSIVESALNPNAVSRVGATGPWQFMFSTAKIYGLNMDNYVDERRDPIQASYAAAAYLRDAYQEFGDWLLAIASYNCGKNSVERAMQQADATDFWSIRQYLPAETRGYVPAFIATTYIMKYYNEHGIIPQACSITLNTDTVLVNKFISLNNVAKALNIDANELSLLNPAYTKRVINGTTKAPRRIVIPQIGKEQYPQLYAALNGEPVTPIKHVVYAAQPVEIPDAAAKAGNLHTVKKGETYSSIADKYGVDVEDLRIWNNAKGSKPAPGQKLKTSAPNLAAGAAKPGKELATLGTTPAAGGN
ncbi:lytic transglycosylase domain-containing protein [Mucilaginibacter terrae]|uniref:Membrane-bound lytic murein transglycosylase D n=1 Tax=Mucilaginibacter terrae TaxID=1955052 RepID=A0ABU3GYJ0_9SPHI|nr:transglycosylase SLT domain-containing protein [Mucilaginibacter terrae]MDT3404496.1 membrane-bound lytic murein transglycosylase D [Mucilaginibacter terrae]